MSRIGSPTVIERTATNNIYTGLAVAGCVAAILALLVIFTRATEVFDSGLM